MRSTNSRPLNRWEREHLARVKQQPCSVCGKAPPSEAHHPRQGDHFTTIALCHDCHAGLLGPEWKIRHMDEWDALNVTLANIAMMT